MTLFLRAILAHIHAGEAARLALGTTVAGTAADSLADARASLDEALELLQRRPEVVAAALDWCEAVRRTDAIAAALRDAIQSDVEQDVVANAGEQHGAAKRSEARALWALRTEVGR